MGLLWKPAIWDGSELLQLPRPVIQLAVRQTWDFLQLKVPLSAGEHVEGRSENGVQIDIAAAAANRQANTFQIDQKSMINRLEDLRQRLRPGTPETVFQFFIWHDSGAKEYRSFRGCSAVEISYDLSEEHLFRYSLSVFARDPKLYVTAPVVGQT